MTTFSGGTIDGSILPSQTGHDLGAASTRWDAFLQDLDASGTLTFGSGAVATLGTLTLGKLNNILFVDGVKYATIAAAEAALPSTGGIVQTPPHYRETITSSVALGSATKPVLLVLNTDTKITCNITNGTSCFVVGEGGGIVGRNVGATPNREGGAVIILASTANVASVITNASKGVGGQGYITLEKIFVNGHASATVTSAGIDLEAVLGQAVLRDVYVVAMPTAGIRLASNASAVAGPFVLDNVWVDGQEIAGNIPLKIAGTTSSFAGAYIDGGVFNGPGASQPAIEILGNAANQLRDIHIRAYIELRTTGNTGIAITDAQNVVVTATEVSQLFANAATGISIAETVANRTQAIVLQGFKATGTSITAISNSITGETIGTSTGYVTQYIYGGSSAFPFVVARNEINIKDASGNILYDLNTNGSTTFRNWLDSAISFVLDSGSSAASTAALYFQDRGTLQWQFQKDASNNLFVFDQVNAKTRLQINKGSGTEPIRGWRFSSSLATALAAGDFASALSAGWGSTASVGSVRGTDQYFELVITSAGTGQGASPTFTYAPKDGTWTTAPVWIVTRQDYGSQPTVTFTVTTQTATSLVLTFNGTPAAAETYKIGIHTGGI